MRFLHWLLRVLAALGRFARRGGGQRRGAGSPPKDIYPMW